MECSRRHHTSGDKGTGHKRVKRSQRLSKLRLKSESKKVNDREPLTGSDLKRNVALSRQNSEHSPPVSGAPTKNASKLQSSSRPIYGPCANAVIGPEGGKLSICGNILQVPQGALTQSTNIKFGLIWDNSLRPQMQTDHQMSAILVCEPSGHRFLKPMILTLPHCLEINPSKSQHLLPVLYSSHHTNGQKLEWTRSPVHKNDFTLHQRTINVKVWDFCFLMWAFEDGTEIEAKKIRIVPYSKPFCEGRDQSIRFHIFDDLEGAREKVRTEERELEGTCLTSAHSYVLLKNFCSLRLTLKWCTPGWLATSQNIEIPFREMWTFDHNSCELHVVNEAGVQGFSCQMVIQQAGNESTVQLAFSNRSQMESQQGTGHGTRRSGICPNEELSCPHQESLAGSIRGNEPLRLFLPTVPPPPEVPCSLLSIAEANVVNTEVSHEDLGRSPPAHPLRLQNFTSSHQRDVSAAIPDCDHSSHLDETTTDAHVSHGKQIVSRGLTSGAVCFQPESRNGQALTQFIFNNITYNSVNSSLTPGDPYSALKLPSTIPLGLMKQLALAIKSELTPGNWMDLARYWKLEKDYSSAADLQDNPGFYILKLALERKIIKSLNDVRNAFETLGRDDCVEMIDKYQEEVPGDNGNGGQDGGKQILKSSNSSQSSLEDMDCNVSPTDDKQGNCAFPQSSSLPLYQPGVDHPVDHSLARVLEGTDSTRSSSRCMSASTRHSSSNQPLSAQDNITGHAGIHCNTTTDAGFRFYQPLTPPHPAIGKHSSDRAITEVSVTSSELDSNQNSASPNR